MSRGSQKYTPVWEGLWTGVHAQRMGKAVFLFGELLNRSRGNPKVRITYSELVEKMEVPRRTLENWMKRLKKEDYISIEGKNPMTLTIRKYRQIKSGKMMPPVTTNQPGSVPPKTVESIPPNLVERVPPELVERENTKPPGLVKFPSIQVVPDSVTHLKTASYDPLLKDKKKRNKNNDSFSSQNPTKNPEAKDKKQSEVHCVIQHYRDEYQRVLGLTPEVTPSACKTFKQLLAGNKNSLDEVKKLITGFLELPDPNLREKGFPAEWLPANVNRIRLKQKQTTRGFVH